MKHIFFRAFTLLEYILYIGIASIVLLAIVLFSRMLIQNQIKQEQLGEVQYSGDFALHTLVFSTQRADGISGSSIFNVNPGKLALVTSTAELVFDTYQKIITRGNSEITITKLRAREGSNPAYDITTDRVNVSQFLISNVSSPGVSSVKIFLSLEAVNPSNSKTYEAKKSWNVTATLRQ